MKLLVLTSAYPSEKNLYAMTFVHGRIKNYLKNNIDVTVLNFSCTKAYEYDSVKVISKLDEPINKFDCIISHAPNLRQHIRFLWPRMKKIRRLVFTFHGHEVIRTYRYSNSFYPKLKPRLACLKSFITKVYDNLKLHVMRYFIRKYIGSNLKVIFVSKWLFKHAITNLGMRPSEFDSNSAIIHNCIGENFIINKHDVSRAKFDFICIRPFDLPYRCIDKVVKLAIQNPGLSFHLYGQGKYFDIYEKPENITLFPKYISSSELPKLLNEYRAALMLTRLDSQGVMVSEMASYGMPVVTSKIPVAQNMFSEFENVFFYKNDDQILHDALTYKPSKDYKIPHKFGPQNTTDKEIKFFSN